MEEDIILEESLSVRRAWIEIRYSEQSAPPKEVALRKESVDRNRLSSISSCVGIVALRKESVDRNISNSC